MGIRAEVRDLSGTTTGRDAEAAADAGAARGEAGPAARSCEGLSEEELCAGAYEAFAYVLLNEPDEQVLTVAEALLVSAGRRLPEQGRDGILADMAQWFRTRLEAPGSPSALPLWEEAVLGAGQGDGRYGRFSGRRTAQVKRAYLEHGFDERGLSGSPAVTSALHADSLAAEAAFMAHLHRKAARGEAGAAEAARDFARKHLARWTREAAALADGCPVYREVMEALADLAQADADPAAQG